MSNKNFEVNASDFGGEESFDFREFLANALSNWHLFLYGVLICLALSFLYIRYSTPSYNIFGVLLVDDAKNNPANGGSSGGGASDMLDISSLLNITNNALNEIEILKSKTIMTDVVNHLQLNVTIYKKGYIKNIELFREAPFKITGLRFRASHKSDTTQLSKSTLEIIDNQHFHFKNTSEDVDIKGRFGDSIKMDEFKFRVEAIQGKRYDPDDNY